MNTRILLITSCLMVLPVLAAAQEAMPAGTMQLPPASPAADATAIPAEPALPPITDNAELDQHIRDLQTAWANIKYNEAEGDAQTEHMKELAAKAAALEATYPNYAELKIWHAITLSTQAGMQGGLGAVDLAHEAKTLLEQAQAINDKALDGSVYTSLGSLYYKVPGWPIGFGDNSKARAYLEQARAMNPDGIDPNYFYGDFLIETNHPKEAIPVLEHALQAAPRPGREVADTGRRAEISTALVKAREMAVE